MTVRIAKPSVNIREKLAELERPIGLNGQALLATKTPQQAFDLLGARNRNRVINGDMRIDQRNNGTATTTHGSFPVDRWMIIKDTGSGSFTIQQSSTAPAKFYQSLLFTVGTAYTPSAGENNFLRYIIEGLTLADLNWGSSNAAPVTLSFWVRSSLSGTFGGSIRNGSTNRSYPFLYTISNANTFEYKIITIPGDVAGTWVTTNASSMEISWGLSVGSSFSGTANAWVGTNFISTSGAINLTSTAGATFYLTGVQLEAGKVATPFEYRSYGEELALCQRYYQEMNMADSETIASGPSISSNRYRFLLPTPVTMRSLPTVATTGSLTFRTGGADYAIANMSSLTLNSNGIIVGGTATSVGNALSGSMHTSGGTSKITLSAEF